jgi:hypothetical protein
VEPDQVNVVAAAVARDSQQVIDALETRFTREIVSNVFPSDLIDGIDDDVAVVHLVAIPDLDVRTGPDSDAAPDSSPADSLTQSLCEDHQRANA